MSEPMPQDQVARLASGYWHTQAIYVAAKLGVADLLSDGPRSADELAAATGSHPRSLYRLLRALASLGLFAEDDDYRFALTPMAECLRSDVPGSVRALCVMRGEWQYAAWGQLLHSVQTGGCAFEQVYGQPLFDHLAAHPETSRSKSFGTSNRTPRFSTPPGGITSRRGASTPPACSPPTSHTLRWNCVTAANPRLFQAPFRAGIKLDAYQIEPLRKALLLPRVNLFIADDVGLGKTIEAGLIARELLLRKKVRDVVACPPSILPQWQDELETRFGLTFQVLDREYFLTTRRERGYATNPWATHTRLLISHRLLIDEQYAGPLRDCSSPKRRKNCA